MNVRAHLSPSSRGLRGIEWSLRAVICRHSSRAFIFASKSNDQICLASSDHFVNFRLAGISTLVVDGNVVLCQVIWLTPSKAAFRQQVTSRSLVYVSLAVGGRLKRSISFLKRKPDDINTPRQEDKSYRTNTNSK